MVKYILTFAAVLMFSTPASAQVDYSVATVRPGVSDQIGETQHAIAQTREKAAAETQKIRENAAQTRQVLMQDLRNSFVTSGAPATDAVRELIPVKMPPEGSLRRLEAGRENLKARLDAAQTAAQERTEQQRAQFQAGLERIKDDRKKQLVSRLDLNLKALSARHRERLTGLLDRISELLSRTESRTAKAEAAGRDVSGVHAKIEAAHSALDAARARIGDQAGKTYTIIVTAEEEVREDATVARNALRSDLEVVHAAVKTARGAVGDVLVALGQIQGVDEIEPSQSTTTSITP